MWGAGSISGGVQYNDEMKKITKHRRYAFNNPVRFAGEPVAAVAAIDRHLAEEALKLNRGRLRTIAVRPSIPRKRSSPVRRRSGRKAPLTQREERESSRSARAAATWRKASPRRITCSRSAFSTSFQHNAQMEPRVCLAAWEGDKLTVYTPTGGIANCRTDMARDLGIPSEKRPRRSAAYNGRQLRQQESESGRRSDRGVAGEGGRRAACTAAGRPRSTTKSA